MEGVGGGVGGGDRRTQIMTKGALLRLVRVGIGGVRGEVGEIPRYGNGVFRGVVRGGVRGDVMRLLGEKLE